MIPTSLTEQVRLISVTISQQNAVQNATGCLLLMRVNDNFETYPDETQLELLKVLHPGWYPSYPAIAALFERQGITLDRYGEFLRGTTIWTGLVAYIAQQKSRNKS
jgi:hypothetical protein